MHVTHASNSQLSEYARCGKAYELRRKHHVPSQPAAWLVGGSAVHAAIEKVNLLLLDEVPLITDADIEVIWEEAWALQLEQEQRLHPDSKPEDYRAAGRGSQTLDWWKDNGMSHVQAWHTFATENGWKPAVWNDVPLIEFDVACNYGYGDEIVLVKGYADLVAEQPDGTWVLLDIKTGSRPVSTFQQLGLYACSMERLGMPRPKMGGYFMSRTGKLGSINPLAQYTGEYFDGLFAQFRKGVENDLFLPFVGDHCRICDVSHACHAYGGQHAEQYDPDSPAYDRKMLATTDHKEV